MRFRPYKASYLNHLGVRVLAHELNSLFRPTGTVLPDVVVEIANTSQKVGLGDLLPQCSVILFFSSACPACEQAAPAWRDVGSADVAGIAMPVLWFQNKRDSNGMKWLRNHRLPKTYRVSDEVYAALGVRFVPQAYIISPDRVLLQNVIGRRDEVEKVGDMDDGSIAAACVGPAKSDVTGVVAN